MTKIKLLLLLLLLTSCANSVDYIYDGDTIRVGATRIRLLDIDCAEMDTDLGRTQRKMLIDYLKGKDIQLTYGRRYDKYGRTLAYVWANSELVNQWLIDNCQCERWIYGEEN